MDFSRISPVIYGGTHSNFLPSAQNSKTKYAALRNFLDESLREKRDTSLKMGKIHY